MGVFQLVFLFFCGNIVDVFFVVDFLEDFVCLWFMFDFKDIFDVVFDVEYCYGDWDSCVMDDFGGLFQWFCDWVDGI